MIKRQSTVLLVCVCWVLALGAAASISAQSPTSLNGRTLQFTITSGIFPFASSGVFRVLPSASDNRYAIVPVSGNMDATSGTYTYTKTGLQSATVSGIDSDRGPLNASFQFTSASSGTFQITSVLEPGASMSGTFVMFSGAAPPSLVGKIVTVIITSGEAPFGDSGSYQFISDASGSNYQIIGLVGIADSSGTYSYSQTSPTTGSATFTDSITGSGFSQQLSFDSSTSGSAYLRNVGSSGYQTAVFSISSSVVAPEITLHPGNQSISLGESVFLSVSATGTEPLAYQWHKSVF